MVHLVDELKERAETAIATMREAARAARDLHAQAELMRHMLLTARGAAEQPRDDAVAFIVHHWLAAWNLQRESWPHVADMEHFAGACYDYVHAPTDACDAAVRAGANAIEQAFAGAGMPLADQMAWRSECAHGWWAQIAPPPPGSGRPDRDWPAAPFWAHGCPPHCR